jgi:hypothetical protein
MTTRVPCVKCGHENDVNRVFCTECGAKLDFSQVRITVKKRTEGPSPALRGLRSLVSLAVLAVAGIALWPARPAGARGTSADAAGFKSKLAELSLAVSAGQGAVQVVSEAEVNAYLAEGLRVPEKPGSVGGARRMRLSDVNLSFQPAQVVVLVLAKWGPLPLSYEVSGAPAAGAGPFRFDVRRARLGHLPMPGGGARWMAGRVATVFSRMAREKDVLDRLVRLDLGQGRVRVVTQGG